MTGNKQGVNFPVSNVHTDYNLCSDDTQCQRDYCLHVFIFLMREHLFYVCNVAFGFPFKRQT